MSAMEKAHAFVDGMAAAIKAQSAAQGRPVSCRGAGCFGCCKEPTYVEKREAAWVLWQLTATQRDELKARVTTWWREFQAAGFHRKSGDEETHPWMFRYRSRNLYCPLLAAGECSVYAQRPIACRTHFAVGDPIRCFSDVERRAQQYLIVGEIGQISARAIQIMMEGEKRPKAEFDHLGVWLAKLLGIAERDTHTDAAMAIHTRK